MLIASQSRSNANFDSILQSRRAYIFARKPLRTPTSIRPMFKWPSSLTAPALGDDQRNVVVLFPPAKLLNIAHNRRD